MIKLNSTCKGRSNAQSAANETYSACESTEPFRATNLDGFCAFYVLINLFFPTTSRSCRLLCHDLHSLLAFSSYDGKKNGKKRRMQKCKQQVKCQAWQAFASSNSRENIISCAAQRCATKWHSDSAPHSSRCKKCYLIIIINHAPRRLSYLLITNDDGATI